MQTTSTTGMWTLGGLAAGAATLLGTGVVVGSAAWTSADPSFANAILRTTSKITWPLVIVAGGWHLSLLDNLAHAPAVVSGGDAKEALQWTKGLSVAVATFVALYAIGGLASRALYVVACKAPQPSDPHAHEDAAFCQHSARVLAAVLSPAFVVAAAFDRVRRWTATTFGKGA
ncbi:hypothetical protein pqer_cds_104 [Pandoravirus quercus]|uniref:Uncharacterized protein n=1 Tax=Pandoravirus quercus TaxID=2107709 RepID=A0A2U7U7X7_9VIRU|nr:hypothetical protein pqer_cds_104 [Pandoravirus quercus]AVK74526.1 hypothetical protein pqer_cds_104 [Pandoravirus quercus]